MGEREDEARIDESMGEIYRAFLNHDVDVLDRIFADDFTFSDPAGPVASKRQWLDDIAAGTLVFEAIEVTTPTFRHLGDRVLVEGEASIRARYTRSDYSGTFRYMGVYARRDDAWRLVLTSAERAGRKG